jgi:D-alanyl-D-alanine carboxypeptidase (penicillin-binding protein 5/6)
VRRAALALAAGAFCAWSAPATAYDRWPDAATAYLVEVDGVARWSRSDRLPLPPASLAKLLTALIVVETVRDDAIVTVGGRAAAAKGARIGLRAGMRLSAGDLLAAMLVRSANDACLALALHVAVDERAFVARMNAKARALGLADSRFADACGFGGTASARDLATLARAALREPRIAAAVALERARATTQDGRTFEFDNTNALIGRVDGVRGVKTGWTRAAGRCLVAYGERRGVGVLLVLLGAPDRWWDAVAMIETAFEESRASAPR